MKTKIFFSAILLFFFAIGITSCQAVTETAPDFTLNDLDGKPFSLSSAKGKVIILDFWWTLCPPCQMEIPHFISLYNEYKDKGLEIIGIVVDKGGAKVVKPFVEGNGITYPVLISTREVEASYGGVRYYPTTFIINRDGNIVEKFVGYQDKEIFESAIKKLL